jgi:hypothetical protein
MDADAQYVTDAQDSAQEDISESDASQQDVSGPPPQWSCTPVSCSAVEKTTSLGDMRGLNSCAFEMKFEHPISQGEALADSLLARIDAESLGHRRTLSHVIDHANRDGRSGLSSRAKSRLSGPNAKGFRWNTGDDNVDYWYPQGISGSSDAKANGKVDGKRLIITSWYNKTDARPTKGTRLALADISDLGNVRYRLLLLVDPITDSNNKATYKEASYDSGNALHSGGIVWYGDYLFVADTAQGFRVYDLSRIFSINNYQDKTRIGIHGNESFAHGYYYGVPRIARYKWVSDSCKVKFSFIGLDRSSSPPAIISGAYDSSDHNKRILAWPLDPTTHLLEQRGGTTRTSQAAVIGQTRAQGALRVNGHFHISSSSQDGRDGRLYKGKPGHSNTSVKWLYGAEDLYFQRDANRIWTSAEHPGERNVAGIPLP